MNFCYVRFIDVIKMIFFFIRKMEIFRLEGGRINLDVFRFDQLIFLGRVKYFFIVIDLRNILRIVKEFDDVKEFFLQYRCEEIVLFCIDF